MLERGVCPVLVNFRKNLQEYLLGEVLLELAPREVIPHDPYDSRIQSFNEFFCSNLI